MNTLFSVIVPIAAILYAGIMIGWRAAFCVAISVLYAYMRGRIDEWREQQELNSRGHT